MPFDLINILLLVGVGQTIFLLLTIGFSKPSKQLANRILFVLLLAFLWFQLEFFLVRNKWDLHYSVLYGTRFGSWLLVGPLLLFYNRAIMVKDFKMQKIDVLHLLPFLIFALFLPLAVNDLVTNRSLDYGMLTVLDQYNQETLTWKHYLYAFIFVGQFLHMAGYIFVANRQMRTIELQAMQKLSSLQSSKIGTLKLLYRMSLVIALLCFAFIVYLFMTTFWRRNMDHLYVLPMLFLVFGLAYRAMTVPQSVIAMEGPHKKPTPKYARSGLSEEDKQKFIARLDQKMNVDRVYRDNELRLSQLADLLEMSTHHLSQIINEEKELNFFDYINKYRVQEVQDLMSDLDGKTLLQLAYQVGFNNKNSFTTAFKKHVGMTPSKYKKLLKSDESA